MAQKPITAAVWEDISSIILPIYKLWVSLTGEGAQHPKNHSTSFSKFLLAQRPSLCEKINKYVRGEHLRLRIRKIITQQDPHPCAEPGCPNLTWGTYCCMKCKQSSPLVHAKQVKTCLRLYGVPNFAQSVEFQEKLHTAWDERWEGRHPTQHESIKKKLREAWYNNLDANREAPSHKSAREKYGDSWHTELSKRGIASQIKKYGQAFWATDEGKRSARNGMLRKYGVEHPLQSEELKAKRNETTLQLWGREPSGVKEVRSRIHRTSVNREGPDYQQKRARKRQLTNLKRYGVSNTMVVQDKGLKIVKLHGYRFECYGYEPHAIRWLVEERGVHPSTIKTVRELREKACIRVDGHNRYPDLWIEDRPIEVKSIYTLNLTYSQVKRMVQSVPRYTLLVFSGTGQRIEFSRQEVLTLSQAEAIRLLQEREKQRKRTH